MECSLNFNVAKTETQKQKLMKCNNLDLIGGVLWGVFWTLTWLKLKKHIICGKCKNHQNATKLLACLGSVLECSGFGDCYIVGVPAKLNHEDCDCWDDFNQWLDFYIKI